jgi:lipoprotein NlpI
MPFSRPPLARRAAAGFIAAALGAALAFGVGLTAAPAAAEPPPLPPAERTAILDRAAAELAALDRAIAAAPADPALYSRRGDRLLFLGRFAAAVADFEKMIALDPALDAPHWRLGIAYHFAGDFARSSRQFEKYHAYDDRDRENGLWKFLADVRTVGLDRARAAMLPYTRFDREPFPSLYELYAGRLTTDAFLADLEKRGLAANERVQFFARYYAGLHESLHGRPATALAHLRAAVANPWGRTAENGPAYMWQVARLHYEQLAAAPAARP